MKRVWLGILWVGVALVSRVDALTLVGHVGGFVAQEHIEDLEDLDWNGAIADAAVEGTLVGPLQMGVGAELRIDSENRSISSGEQGFGYLKLRLPLPLSPYAGLGISAQKSGSDWKAGQMGMAGIGLRLSRISIDLELRVNRVEIGDAVFRSFSVRPGVSVWF